MTPAQLRAALAVLGGRVEPIVPAGWDKPNGYSLHGPRGAICGVGVDENGDINEFSVQPFLDQIARDDESEARGKVKRKVAAVIRGHIRQVESALDAIGPMPTVPRWGLVSVRHPGADAWEASVAAIGRDFLARVWADAKAGDSVCRSYVQSVLLPDEPPYSVRPIDDVKVAAFGLAITARWTVSLRGTGGED